MNHASGTEHSSALLDWFQQCPGAVVAYSGGVDSVVVAYAAHLALGARCLAVIADSPSLARHELTGAWQVAATIGISLEVITTREQTDPAYQANDRAITGLGNLRPADHW